MPLRFSYNPLQCNSYTTFGTFRRDDDNILIKLPSIPCRHGQIVTVAEEWGGGRMRAHLKGAYL